MTPRSLFDRLFDSFASLRLAVVVMSTLGLTCLFATIYESKHGTPAVQRDVEVGADQHPPARHALGDQVVERSHDRRFPTMTTRSASRLE